MRDLELRRARVRERRPALEAVRAWRYLTLLLNGDPVEVITEIDVNSTLQP